MTRIQPHNLEIEEQVLGIILNNPKVFVTAINIINTNCFYKNEHQIVFNAFTSLYSQSKPIDLISVTTYLRNIDKLDGIGGNFFLMGLMELGNSYNSFEYYCHILLELSERREGIEKSAKLIDSLYDLSTDLDENMVIANEVVLSLSNEVSNIGGQELSQSVIELIKEQENELRGDFSGCKTKFVDLDRIIVGLKNQQVAVLAGRPGMGKTTFGINIAYRLAKFDKTPVGFFSLEMSSVELTKKFAAIESQICNSRIKELDEKTLETYFRSVSSLGDLPIFIDDKPGATVDEIRARAITMKRKNDVKLIVIDYLQLITTKGRGGNREQEISEISRKIKLLAKELNIPIIAISQLSRQVEQSDPKVPFLHHLRESGSIEQDADLVLMLWRPEYYDYPNFEFDGKDMDSRGMVVTYVRKNRNGETGKALMKCNLAYASFYDNSVDNFLLPNYDF